MQQIDLELGGQYLDKLCTVITTINDPNSSVLGWLEGGNQLVVIGDTKTNDEAWNSVNKEGLTYLSFKDCEKKWPKLSSAIGARTYARKNFGYLQAVEQEASFIFETDDDTFLRSGVGNLLEFYGTSDKYKVSRADETDKRNIFNPFAHFAPTQHVWPRGMPLRQVNRRNHFTMQKSDAKFGAVPGQYFKEIDIIQSLVNLDPDVDSIFRMTSTETIVDFPLQKHLLILDEVYAPGNTQSTLWLRPEILPWAYVPQTVSIRFCDILKMYIAQWATNMAYAGFVTEQFRNEHDLMQDFKLEFELFMKIEGVIDLLQGEAPSSIFEAYQLLLSHGIVLEKELEIVELFQNEFKKLS